MHRVLFAVIAMSVPFLAGCEKQPGKPGAGSSPPPSGGAPKQDSPPVDKSSDAAPKQPGHGGPVIDLGTTTLNGQTVKVSRDAGVITPGGDAPIDIWIDGGLGGAAAVRFWIGTEDAKGSIKAKAAIEGNHWHTHAEVPDPMPAGSKLWIEIETDKGTNVTGSFGLAL